MMWRGVLSVVCMWPQQQQQQLTGLDFAADMLQGR
jgi:hypothetical protein